MAEIFVACDPDAPLADQLLVVKRIRSDVCRDTNFVDMFLDEARVFNRLSHPNIVRMHDFGEVAGRYYLVLEYVWGESLAMLLHICDQQRVRFPVGAALYIGAETALALQHAHELRDPGGEISPVIHRDVTLGNVVISYRGEVKLLDFGIAKAKERLARTQVGNVKGTLIYLAPEQIFQEEVSPRTDVYQLGVFLYKLLVGREPVERADEAGIVNAIARGQITPPSKVLPGFPPRIERIILKAMAFRPAQRYPSAAALRQAIADLLGAQLTLGKQNLAGLIRRLTQDRFQRHMSYISALLQGLRAEQDQPDLLRWVASGAEPRRVSVELSDAPTIKRRAVGAAADSETETSDDQPLQDAAIVEAEVDMAPGPVLAIDPRVQAALAQAFDRPVAEKATGGSAREADKVSGDLFEGTGDFDLLLDMHGDTDVAEMRFLDVNALLGEEPPAGEQGGSAGADPAGAGGAFDDNATEETPVSLPPLDPSAAASARAESKLDLIPGFAAFDQIADESDTAQTSPWSRSQEQVQELLVRLKTERIDADPETFEDVTDPDPPSRPRAPSGLRRDDEDEPEE